jgi:uncharacterized glyoxalase superfamily protein PhnB
MSARLDAIGIVVSDIQTSVAFYRRLGVEFPDPSGDGHIEATIAGSLRLMLDTVETIKSFDPNWEPPSGGHRIGLAFLCDSPAEVDSVYKELVDSGVESYKEPWDAFWGQRYAEVKDPDGNIVDLFAPLGG